MTDFDEHGTVEKCDLIGQAVRLLNEIGHQHDRHLALEHEQDILDFHRRDRIDGDRELVETQNLRTMRQRPRNRQPLLLTPGKLRAKHVHAILDLFPQGRLPQTFFHQRVQLGTVAHPGHPRRVGYVVVHRQRQPDGKREHHADLPPQIVHVPYSEHVLVIDEHFTFHFHARNEIDRAVDAFEPGRLPRIGRADYPEDLVTRDRERDVLKRRLRAVPHRHVAEGDVCRVTRLYHRFRDRR